MFYINDEIFARLLKGGQKIETRDPWGLRERLNAYPGIRHWDSGERIAPSSGQWEEQALLINAAGELYLEVQEVYYGERYGNKPPAFYRISRELCESALAAEGAQK